MQWYAHPMMPFIPVYKGKEVYGCTHHLHTLFTSGVDRYPKRVLVNVPLIITITG
jgi:hypothetical protein